MELVHLLHSLACWRQSITPPLEAACSIPLTKREQGAVTGAAIGAGIGVVDVHELKTGGWKDEHRDVVLDKEVDCCRLNVASE